MAQTKQTTWELVLGTSWYLARDCIVVDNEQDNVKCVNLFAKLNFDVYVVQVYRCALKKNCFFNN